MDPMVALNLAVLAGELMLRSGAETYRVEDIITRMLENCGFQFPESFVTTTGIFASVKTAEGPATLIRRVDGRTTDFQKLIAVNDISRSFAEEKITFDQALEKLEHIESLPQISPVVRIFASAISCFCFTYVFDGGILDCANAFFTGLLLQALLIPLYEKNIASVLVNMIGGAAVALFALIFMNIGLGHHIDTIIIGSIVPLLPGVALTNAFRDILEGDYLSGTSRTTEAVIVAVGIATGVGTVLEIWTHAFGGVLI